MPEEESEEESDIDIVHDVEDKTREGEEADGDWLGSGTETAWDAAEEDFGLQHNPFCSFRLLILCRPEFRDLFLIGILKINTTYALLNKNTVQYLLAPFAYFATWPT